jgi:hypothetical protein
VGADAPEAHVRLGLPVFRTFGMSYPCPPRTFPVSIYKINHLGWNKRGEKRGYCPRDKVRMSTFGPATARGNSL